MKGQSDPGERSGTARSKTRDELRVIGFRLREIQRLLARRVEQEDRRLEAEGLAPVADPVRSGRDERPGVPAGDGTRYLVEALARLDVFEEARVVLDDGTAIEGRVNPIAYTPNERLRLEIRPRGRDARYELRAACRDDRWTEPVVRRYGPEDDDWTELGALDALWTLGR